MILCVMLQEGDTVVGREDASKLPDIGITTYVAVYDLTTCSVCHLFCSYVCVLPWICDVSASK